MKRRQFIAIAAALAPSFPWAQPRDTDPLWGPLRLVFPFPAGGAGDALARALAADLADALGRPVVVENRTGAAGRLGVQAVRAAGADGGALLLTPSAPMVVYPHLYENLGYDPMRDFAPVARVAAFEMAVVVDPALPVRTPQELAAWLAANPQRTNYGTPGTGTLAHLVMAALASHWALPLVHVPYRGTPPALMDVAGGRLSMACSAIGEMMPAHREGRVRIVATSGTVRSAFSPDTLTLREAGVPFSAVNWYGVYAPASSSQDFLRRVSAALLAFVGSDDFRRKALSLGFQPAPADGAALGAAQREESEFWARVIRGADIRVAS